MRSMMHAVQRTSIKNIRHGQNLSLHISRDSAPAKNAAAFAFTHPLRYIGRARCCAAVATVTTRCHVPSARCVSETFPVKQSGTEQARTLLSCKSVRPPQRVQ